MSVEGTILNGRIELDEVPSLPDGTRVRVELEAIEPPSKDEKPSRGSPTSSLAKRLLALAGRAKGLPSDMARNHDHYIHGARKR